MHLCGMDFVINFTQHENFIDINSYLYTKIVWFVISSWTTANVRRKTNQGLPKFAWALPRREILYPKTYFS